MYLVERLAPIQFPLVNRFYKEAGHKGKARGDDVVFVLKAHGIIRAAVRLCPVEGRLFLRGLWVMPEFQRQGLGSVLMQQVIEQYLQGRYCWCYPFAHLEVFYSQFGFKVVAPESVPECIAGPYTAYTRAGKAILIMIRDDSDPESVPD
ncbi:GCN5-related N-acetyltransferase [Oleiphilus messinensis]|uniref:GCN5-related N-acetyltransferase n=1 Tax=Oleiphilus messinensis TaxID=141451 RepID=A0A1Y0I3B3_9GAMM|nr:GNAT family N-acetyltransferase [Oleiphilus messinensis]ARU54962.1 GCN5-related N-acetyltransferase [Oleiphilus messinensis]